MEVGKTTVVTFKPGITVCIPAIPPRAAMLAKAIESVGEAAKTVKNSHPGTPVHCAVELDDGRRGAPWTRHQALLRAGTEYVAFLDDDDVMDPWHLTVLYDSMLSYEADYVWSRFRVGYPDGTFNPGPAPLGAGSFQQWNDEQPAQTTVTTMVRTELALDVGGFLEAPGAGEIDEQRAGEDWAFTLACRAAGGTFRHVPVVSWTWNHHGANTSGLSERW